MLICTGRAYGPYGSWVNDMNKQQFSSDIIFNFSYLKNKQLNSNIFLSSCIIILIPIFATLPLIFIFGILLSILISCLFISKLIFNFLLFKSLFNYYLIYLNKEYRIKVNTCNIVVLAFSLIFSNGFFISWELIFIFFYVVLNIHFLILLSILIFLYFNWNIYFSSINCFIHIKIKSLNFR